MRSGSDRKTAMVHFPPSCRSVNCCVSNWCAWAQGTKWTQVRNHRIPRPDGTGGVILSTPSLQAGLLTNRLGRRARYPFHHDLGRTEHADNQGLPGHRRSLQRTLVCVYSGSSCLKALPRVRGRSLTWAAESNALKCQKSTRQYKYTEEHTRKMYWIILCKFTAHGAAEREERSLNRQQTVSGWMGHGFCCPPRESPRKT